MEKVFFTISLSLGSHVIRLNATDSNGVTAQDLISLEIIELTKSEILNDED